MSLQPWKRHSRRIILSILLCEGLLWHKVVQLNAKSAGQKSQQDQTGATPHNAYPFRRPGQIQKNVQANEESSERQQKTVEHCAAAALPLSDEVMADDAQVDGHEAEKRSEVHGLRRKLKGEKESTEDSYHANRQHAIGRCGVFGMNVSEKSRRQQTIAAHAKKKPRCACLTCYGAGEAGHHQHKGHHGEQSRASRHASDVKKGRFHAGETFEVGPRQ